MKKKALLVMLILLIVSCTSQNKTTTIKIDIETLKAKAIGKDVQFMDVRTAKEYNAGHIDDAINIDITDKNNFVKEISTLDKTKPIYIYCQKGGRSNKARKVLETAGFTEIYDFSGGWKSWSEHN
jgi:rhodanese-related sulfurtransferase